MPAFVSFLISITTILVVFSIIFKHFIFLLIFIPLIVFFLLLSKRKFFVLNLFLIFIVSSSSFIQIKPYLLNSIPQDLYGETVSITGKVSDYSEETIYPKSFVVNNLTVKSVKFSGSLRVYTEQDFPPPFSIVTIKGKLNKIDLNSDIEKLTRCQYSMYSDEILVKSTFIPAQLLSQVRQQIIDRIKLSMKSEEAFLLLSSIMGVYSLSRDERAPFEETGTSHIFAVSGLHMSILGETLNKFWGLIFVSSPLISLFILFLFILLLGFKVSAFRAVLMYTVFVLAKITGREPNNLNILGSAGLIILIFSPLSIFSVSFELSFMSIFALFVFAPFLSGSLPNKLSFKVLAATASIQIFLLPLIAFYYGTFSFSSFIANLFAIPYMSILVPTGFMQITFSFFGIRLSSLFALISNFLYRVLNSAIDLISRLPFSSINVKFPFSGVILFFSILSFLIVFLLKRKKLMLFSILIVMFIFILFGFVPVSFSIQPSQLGGENCFVIRDRSATVLLFFKNPNEKILNMSNTLERKLKLEGVNSINLALITYPITDKDYSNALEFAKESNVKIENIMLPNPDDELIKIFLTQLRKKSIVEEFKKDSVVRVGDLSVNFISQNAILLERNNKKYFLLGNSEPFNPSVIIKARLEEIYFPRDFELNSIKGWFEVGKLCKY